MQQPDLAYRAALGDLVSMRRGGSCLGADHLKSWTTAAGKSPGETLDAIARELATDYAFGTLTWDFCDWAINNLNPLRFDIMEEDAGTFSRDFDRVYEAFDASEWVEPAEREAKALAGIAAFLSSINIIVNN